MMYAIQIADFLILRRDDPVLCLVLVPLMAHSAVSVGAERFDDEAIPFACPPEQAAAMIEIIRTKYRKDSIRMYRNDTGAKSAWKRV